MDFEISHNYRGRLAPSPTGFLHLGHAYTFWTAQQRALDSGGVLVLRNEDLDTARSRDEYAEAFVEDLNWLGIDWQEGYGIGGPHGPYSQSQRFAKYADAFESLKAGGFVYPCVCSRQDVIRALSAPHEGGDEPIYPRTCLGAQITATNVNWRFRVPTGEAVSFTDGCFGPQIFVGGKDFGDFVVWRHDNGPAYQLAVVVDDAEMGITEVVRGSDLLISAARQILIYRALGLTAPSFYHCPLVYDEDGNRLAKRHQAQTIRALRQSGISAEELKSVWRAGLQASNDMPTCKRASI